MNLSTWIPTLVILAIVFGIKLVADLLEKRPVDTDKLPFIKNNDSLTNSEKYFFRFLENLPIVKDNYYIFPQLSLSKLVTLPDNLKRSWSLINKIDRKSVDFVLFDRASLKPILAIELDGASHNSLDRQERDDFVDQVFKTARVPLVHIRRNDTGYDSEDITQKIISA